VAGAGQRGAGFGADLHWLCWAGRYDLPSVAAAYAKASSSVASTGDMRVEYQGSEPFDGSATLAAWTALRDEVQVVLSTMATTLEQAGEALCQSAAAYAATDHEAAVEMDRLNRQIPTDVPRVPQVRYPAGWAASHPGGAA
jgi:cytochrome c556